MRTASIKDEDSDRLMLSRSPRFQALLEQSRKSIRAGKGLSSKEFWKAVKKRADKKGRRQDRSLQKAK